MKTIKISGAFNSEKPLGSARLKPINGSLIWVYDINSLEELFNLKEIKGKSLIISVSVIKEVDYDVVIVTE